MATADNGEAVAAAADLGAAAATDGAPPAVAADGFAGEWPLALLLASDWCRDHYLWMVLAIFGPLFLPILRSMYDQWATQRLLRKYPYAVLLSDELYLHHKLVRGTIDLLRGIVGGLGVLCLAVVAACWKLLLESIILFFRLGILLMQLARHGYQGTLTTLQQLHRRARRRSTLLRRSSRDQPQHAEPPQDRHVVFVEHSNGDVKTTRFRYDPRATPANRATAEPSKTPPPPTTQVINDRHAARPLHPSIRQYNVPSSSQPANVKHAGATPPPSRHRPSSKTRPFLGKSRDRHDNIIPSRPLLPLSQQWRQHEQALSQLVGAATALPMLPSNHYGRPRIFGGKRLRSTPLPLPKKQRREREQRLWNALNQVPITSNESLNTTTAAADTSTSVTSPESVRQLLGATNPSTTTVAPAAAVETSQFTAAEAAPVFEFGKVSTTSVVPATSNTSKGTADTANPPRTPAFSFGAPPANGSNTPANDEANDASAQAFEPSSFQFGAATPGATTTSISASTLAANAATRWPPSSQQAAAPQPAFAFGSTPSNTPPPGPVPANFLTTNTAPPAPSAFAGAATSTTIASSAHFPSDDMQQARLRRKLAKDRQAKSGRR